MLLKRLGFLQSHSNFTTDRDEETIFEDKHKNPGIISLIMTSHIPD